jgi:cyanophycin synthetase
MFPPGESGRIPLISVAGTRGRTITTHLIAHLLRQRGHQVGMASAEGTFLNSRHLSRHDGTGPTSARNIRINPWVETGVFETSAEGILHEGLGFDFCDVAVVTHLGENEDRDGEIPAEEQPILQHTDSAYRVLMNSVASTGWAVLKADDPATAALAEHCRGGVIYFAQNEQNPLLLEHREQGGRVAFVREQVVTLAEGNQEQSVISLAQLALTRQNAADLEVEHVLATVGAAWALNIPFETIGESLLSFTSNVGAIKTCQTPCNGNGATHTGRNGSHNGKASHIAPSAGPTGPSPSNADEASLPATGASEVTS